MKRSFVEKNEDRQSPVSVATDINIEVSSRKKVKVLEPFSEAELVFEAPSIHSNPPVHHAINEEAIRAALIRRKELIKTLLQKFK